MTENKKLSWAEIEKRYDQQWVLLEDFEWTVGQPYPSSGVVVCHSPNKKEFDAEAKKNNTSKTAWLFAGKPVVPENTVISCNLFRMTMTECN